MGFKVKGEAGQPLLWVPWIQLPIIMYRGGNQCLNRTLRKGEKRVAGRGTRGQEKWSLYPLWKSLPFENCFLILHDFQPCGSKLCKGGETFILRGYRGFLTQFLFLPMSDKNWDPQFKVRVLGIAPLKKQFSMISLLTAARSDGLGIHYAPHFSPPREQFGHRGMTAGEKGTPCSRYQERSGRGFFLKLFPHPAPFQGSWVHDFVSWFGKRQALWSHCADPNDSRVALGIYPDSDFVIHVFILLMSSKVN